MSKHLSIMRFLSAVLLLDVVLIGAVFVSGPGAYAFLAAYLPGTFGPGMGPQLTGNHLLGALILQLDALLFLLGGFLVLADAARNTLMIGSSGIWRLLRGTAGLSREDIAATSFAVAEEQKSEIHVVRTGRGLIWIGALLLLLAFPAVCFTFAQADSKGAPLLQDAGGAVANSALSIEDVAVFAVDQLADAVLLDIPRVFQLHVTSLTPAHNHSWLRPFVLLFHILSKLVVLATLFAAWRNGHLRAYLLQMAGVDAVPALASFRDAPPPSPHEDSEEMLRQASAVVLEPLADHGDPAGHVEHHLFEVTPVVHAAVEHTLQEEMPEPEPVPEEVMEYQPQEEAPAPEPSIPAEPAPAYYEAVDQTRQPELPLEDAAPAPEAVVEVLADPEPAHHDVAAMQEPIPVEPVHREEEATPALEAAVAEVPAAAEPAHHNAGAMQEPIPVEPVHRVPEQHETPMHEGPEHEEPATPDASILDAPVLAEPPAAAAEEPALFDAPLALHELKSPEEAAEEPTGDAESQNDPKPPFPYRNTALHVPQDFDA